MGKNVTGIFLLFYLIPLILPGQCPDKKQLRERIIYLKDASRTSADKRLQELLSYEAAAPRCSFKNDSTRVLLFQTISKVYQDNSDYQNSILYTNKAINLVAANQGNQSINPDCQITNYYNLSLFYGLIKKTNEKVKAYDSCIANAIRLNIVNRFLLYSLLEKVRYLNNIGEYNSCIEWANLGEVQSHRLVETRAAATDDSTSFSLDFANEKITALVVLGQIKKAETFLLDKIAEIKRKKAADYLGSLYEQLALIKVDLKNLKNGFSIKEGFSYFKLALRCYKQQKDTLSYKIAVHNIGYTIYQEINKDDEQALLWYKKSLKYKIRDSIRSISDSINCISIYSNIADIFVRKKNFDSAQYYFQCAFNQIKNGTNETEILNGSFDEDIIKQKAEYVTGLLIDKGNAFYEEFRTTKDTIAIQKAIKIYKLTDEFLDRIKSHQLEFQSKLFWRKDTHHFYEQALEACKAGNRPEDAFYFFERSRAILLYDQMDEQKWLGEADILKERELINKIDDKKRKLSEITPSSSDFPKIQNDLWQLQEELRQSTQKIKARNPLYYQSFLSSNLVRLADIYRYLSRNQQSLLEIFNGDSSVYSLIITNGKIYFNEINKAGYEKDADFCMSYMSNANLPSSNREFQLFAKSSQRLYNLIFQNSRVPNGRIIISADGRHIPFESLVTHFEEGEPVFFVQQHAVSYAYSARYLMSQFTAHSPFTAKDFLGIAPVTFPKSSGLPTLHGSDTAVETVKEFFDRPETFLRQKATRRNFIENFGHFQIIQLYSHSSDTSNNKEPVIYFADKPLYLSELSNIETPVTKLVVLSACETGNGEFYQGEGVFSFNRAFAALGIPSCINNLWSVDDHSTYKITSSFYKYISEGLPIDSALQKAKIEYINSAASQEEKRPYYWAATILSGTANAIHFTKKSNPNFIVLLGTGMIIFISLIVVLTNTWKKRSSFTILGQH